GRGRHAEAAGRRLAHRLEVAEIEVAYPVEHGLAGRDAAQADLRGVVGGLDRQRSLDALGVGEAFGGGVFDDHAGRPVGATPDDAAVGLQVARLHALRQLRPPARRGLREDAGREGRHGTRAQQAAACEPAHARSLARIAETRHTRRMEWTDHGIVLSSRPHGETGVVASLLTREHGRHAGFIHGGVSRKSKPIWQPGNVVDVTWRAKAAEQLGNFTGEARESHAARVLDDASELSGLAAACAMADTALPEREPHPAMYEGFHAFLGVLGHPGWPAIYIR